MEGERLLHHTSLCRCCSTKVFVKKSCSNSGVESWHCEEVLHASLLLHCSLHRRHVSTVVLSHDVARSLTALACKKAVGSCSSLCQLQFCAAGALQESAQGRRSPDLHQIPLALLIWAFQRLLACPDFCSLTPRTTLFEFACVETSPGGGVSSAHSHVQGAMLVEVSRVCVCGGRWWGPSSCAAMAWWRAWSSVMMATPSLGTVAPLPAKWVPSSCPPHTVLPVVHFSCLPPSGSLLVVPCSYFPFSWSSSHTSPSCGPLPILPLLVAPFLWPPASGPVLDGSF